MLKKKQKQTKALIFQKKNRKSIRDKCTFFVNGNQIVNFSEYSYPGITFGSMVIFHFPNSYQPRKQEYQYLVQNVIVILTRFQVLYAINFLMFCFFLFYFKVLRRTRCLPQRWSQKWEKGAIEKIHSWFEKHFVGLNRRATNIVFIS